ncbi:transporter substrate-binding domain-containing protein [Roseovarius aestuarii]|nr:transporter substrate-binding domain-containing protein [Roseovarius aestuarii]
MRFTSFVGCLMLAALWGGGAGAQPCGGEYTVRPGDSLQQIAQTQYGASELWTTIHADNLARIGEKASAIRPGMRLMLKCVNGRPRGLGRGNSAGQTVIKATASLAGRPGINLLTAGDNAPFTALDLPNGGLMTDIVNAAMQRADPSGGYAIRWVEDWGAHLDPLLSGGLLDMGFPWAQPECALSPDDVLCAGFLFSDPMFEMLSVVFTDKAASVSIGKVDDLVGRVLCRPRGQDLSDLDRADRRWLSDAKVVLKQPQTVQMCFDMLMAGAVDAVAVNEFVGRAAIRKMGLTRRIEIGQSYPLAIETLHVVVHKDHPQAETLLNLINAGLRGLREDGEFQAIVDAHLTRFWEEY